MSYFLIYIHSPSKLPFHSNTTFDTMGFFTPSPTSGAEPKIGAVFSTLWIVGSLTAVLAVLISSLYIPCLRLSNPIFNPTVTAAILSLHAVLFGMSLWSLARVKITNPGYVARPNKLTASEVRAIEAGTLEYCPFTTQDLLSREFVFCEQNGNPKFCTTCKILRPTRSTHCDQLGRCVVKLDHFCPTLFSAVGVGNYKYFIQFVGWTLALVTYIQVVGFIAVAEIREVDAAAARSGFVALGTIASFVGDMFLLPLFGMHLKLVMNNIATREEIGPLLACTKPALTGKCLRWVENPRARKYVRCNLEYDFLEYDTIPPSDGKFVVVELDLTDCRPWGSDSVWENWSSVMGTTVWEWILPIAPTRMDMDGRRFWEFDFNERTKEELREKVKKSLAEMKSGHGSASCKYSEALTKPLKCYIPESVC
jgi:hypothetical protein